MQPASEIPPDLPPRATVVWWRAWDILRARRAMLPVMALWLAVTAITTATGLATAGWHAIPLRLGPLTVNLTFYPPVAISVLLTLLMGPAWGVSCAYISGFLVSSHAGIDLLSGIVLAMATPMMLLVLWSSMVMLDVNPSLKTACDWGRFAGLALIAISASSVGALIWDLAYGLALDRAGAIWEGWLVGDFLQVVLIAGPILHFGYARARCRLVSIIAVQPRRTLGTRMYIAVFALVLTLLTLSGVDAERLLMGSLKHAGGPGTHLAATLDPMLSFVGAYLLVFLAVVIVFSLTLGVLLERDKHAASTDSLTRCLNRRAFLSIFSACADGLPMDPAGMALIVLDLDDFKGVNDRYGHFAGDEVLSVFAERVKGLIRHSDYLFRWGGEEFAVLLPHTGVIQAYDIAERIRASLDSEPMAITSGDVRITVSAGVSHAAHPPVSVESLFGRADAACYRAKERGRNRVEIMAAA